MPNQRHPAELIELGDQLLHPEADVSWGHRRSLAQHRAQYRAFALRHDLPAELTAMDPLELAAFAYELVHVVGAKPQSASIYVGGLARSWREETGRHDDIDVTARQVLRAAREQLPQRARRPAAVLPLWLMLDMLDQMRPGQPGYETSGSGRKLGEWRAARDRALLATLFSGALRPSEPLAADVADLARHADGWELAIPYSKTNQHGERIEHAFLADTDLLGTGRLLSDWLELRGELEFGGLFPSEPHGLPMSYTRASLRIREAAARAGHADNAISLYSFRRTRATLAALMGAELRAISRWLRHSSQRTTSLYIDALSHIVDDEDVAAFYLARTRPHGAHPNGLGRGHQPHLRPDRIDGRFVARAASHQAAPMIDELRDLALEAAQRGRYPYADSTWKEIRRVEARWTEFCHNHGIDADEPAPEHVAAWTILMRDKGTSGAAINAYVHQLERAFVIDDPTVPPPSWQARHVADTFRRQDADKEQTETTQAPVHPRETWCEIVRDLANSQASTRDLDRIILRWQAATAAGGRLRGPLRRSEVAIDPAGRWVEVTSRGTTYRLPRQTSPLRCPVRAAQRLLAATPGDIVVARWKTIASGYHDHGLHTRVEDWTAEQFGYGTWLSGRPIRETARMRLLIAVGWAAALRMADLREARIEELDRDHHGYTLHLGRSKTNRDNAPEAIRLKETGDELCPVAAIDDWRELWPAPCGPLLTGCIDHRSATADGTEPSASRHVTFDLVAAISRIGGVELTGHSLRRSRASHDWHLHYDLQRIRRLLRHRSLEWTARYIEDLDPLSLDITRGLAASNHDTPQTAEHSS